MIETRKLRVLTVALLILISIITPRAFPNPSVLPDSVASDPLGRFQGQGPAASLSWTGDGERILNPSFETGTLAPWVQSSYLNATGSGAILTGPGYLDSNSAQLSIYSGNTSALSLKQPSHVSLTEDLTQQKIAFNTASRFRTAVFVKALTGNNESDRVEAVLRLSTSTGFVRTIHYVFADGSTLPGNTTSDAYLKVPSFGMTGQWIPIDRNLASDAAASFPVDYPAIDSVLSIGLVAFSRTQPGPAIVDSHLKYYDAAFHFWTAGEPVIYDADNDGRFNASRGDINIGCAQAGCPSPLGLNFSSTDPRIKFADSNQNNQWDCATIVASNCTSGEAVVYDNEQGTNAPCNGPVGNQTCNGDGVYDVVENVIGPSAQLVTRPPGDTFLMRPTQRLTQALFDRVELYSASASYDWIRNGGFETGLAAWYKNPSFTSVSSPVHSGTKSAQATILSGTAEMAQSIDAHPFVNSTMNFKASVDTTTMTGISSSDYVDTWISLADSQGNPISLYYYFKTGDGTVPTNKTDAVYLKANGFGTSGWLSINVNLLQLVQAVVSSNSLAYTGTYTVEIIVAEASASQFRTTTAYFDDFSLSGSLTGTAPSYFYAVDGLNSTYAYSAYLIPQGSFSIDVPQGQSLLNVTSPDGSILQPGQYSSSVLSGLRRIDVLDSGMFNQAPLGNWTIFTTSTNAVASVATIDPTTGGSVSTITPGSTVNLSSLTKDPSGQAIAGADGNFTLWQGTTTVGQWQGTTSSQGWLNVTGIIAPQSLGIYTLQASVNSANGYVGIRTVQVTIATPGFSQLTLAIILVAIIAAIAVIAFLFLQKRSKKPQSIPEQENAGETPKPEHAPVKKPGPTPSKKPAGKTRPK